MQPLRCVVTSPSVQGRMLMTENARQNKTNRYGGKDLSRVDNKEIRAGWKHGSRLLDNNFAQVFVPNETRNQNLLLNKNLFKVNNRTPVPTKTPEQHQGIVLVVLLPAPNALHTQLQHSILPFQTDKHWKC